MRHLMTLLAFVAVSGLMAVGCSTGAAVEEGGGDSAVSDKDATTAATLDYDGDGTHADDSDSEMPHEGDDNNAEHGTTPIGSETDMKLAVYSNADGKLLCPVMGGTIESKDKAVGYADHNGKRYYFCCAACPAVFEKNKDKYAK